jgi:hypothetical protein
MGRNAGYLPTSNGGDLTARDLLGPLETTVSRSHTNVARSLGAPNLTFSHIDNGVGTQGAAGAHKELVLRQATFAPSPPASPYPGSSTTG